MHNLITYKSFLHCLLDLDSTMINHPVHIITHDNKISPSAMGVEIYQFVVPVRNSFQAKIMNDQLCYEVDLNKFSDENNIRQVCLTLG